MSVLRVGRCSDVIDERYLAELHTSLTQLVTIFVVFLGLQLCEHSQKSTKSAIGYADRRDSIRYTRYRDSAAPSERCVRASSVHGGNDYSSTGIIGVSVVDGDDRRTTSVDKTDVYAVFTRSYRPLDGPADGPVLCPVSDDVSGVYPGCVRRMSAGRHKSDTTPDRPGDVSGG